MLQKWDKGEINFTPICPRLIYDVQVKIMQDYLAALEARAVIEKIEYLTSDGDLNHVSVDASSKDDAEEKAKQECWGIDQIVDIKN